MQTYKGREYAPDSAVATAVELQLEGEVLIVKATVSGSEAQLEKVGKLHLNDFEIEVGGFSSTTTMLKHVPSKTTLMVEDATLLDALSATKTPLAEKAAKARGQIKAVPRKVATTWGIVLGGTFALVAAVYLSLEGIIDWVAERTPPSVERFVGETYVRIMPGNNERAETPNQRRIDKIAKRLVDNIKNNPYRFEFIVVESEDVNAASLPGGIVIVNSGLINHAESDDEIAGVLAHEIGHVTRKHALRKMLHSIGIGNLVSIVFGGISPEAATIMSQAVDLEGLSYGRAKEFDADSVGTQLAYESDYNPNGLVGFFTRMQEELGGNNKLLEIVSTHPMPADRVDRIKQQIEKLEATRKANKAKRDAQRHAQAEP